MSVIIVLNTVLVFIKSSNMAAGASNSNTSFALKV